MKLKKNIRNFINTSFKIPRLPFPTELEFEPIQLCNAKCFVCPYTRLQEDKDYLGKKMSSDKIKLLIKDFGRLLKKNNYTGPTIINPFRYSDPLVCRDLELIFNTVKEYNLKIRITTNGVSFNEKYSELLNKNLNQIVGPISISIIGSTREKIKKYMSVNYDTTLERLKKVSEKYPILSKSIEVSLSEVDASNEEFLEFKELEEDFKKLNIKTIKKKKWINNRIMGDWKVTSHQDKKNNDNLLLSGCKLFKNKLLRRIEVMVDGSVVLCDDDAEGKLKFGNVFEEGIEKIWNGSLLDYHKKIYDKLYSSDKDSLICNSCSRAQYNQRQDGILDSFMEMGKVKLLKQLSNRDVKWL